MEPNIIEEKHFCLNDYDCIAFDMDHTMIQYHLPEVFKVCESFILLCDVSAIFYFKLVYIYMIDWGTDKIPQDKTPQDKKKR